MPGDGARLIRVAVVFAAMTSAGAAQAFCRTMTCPTPADYPQGNDCYPPDFESYCASLTPPRKVLPVYWVNACITYDINQAASRQVPYATAVAQFAAAFSKWTGTVCGGDASDAGAGGKVSIDVRDLGPVSCDALTYNTDEGNQNVIIFHDDVWPYSDANNTLGLTTISYDPDTGELDDADMEINATVPLTVGDPVPEAGYDFESIIAHETGHFFGMAHSTEPTATMFAHYTPGATAMRLLKADDMDGICSIYAPDGNRSVSNSVSATSTLPAGACDPAPKGGFQSACTVPKGCAVSAPGRREAPQVRALAWLAGALAIVVRRRSRGRATRADAPRSW